MRALRFAVLALSLTVAHVAQAQRIEPIGAAAHPALAAHAPLKAAAVLPGNSGMPHWLRWGIVGAIGGAAVFALVDGLNNSGRHSIGSDIFAGAATGFVVVGGGVLLYDSVCSSGSRSSFCGR